MNDTDIARLSEATGPFRYRTQSAIESVKQAIESNPKIVLFVLDGSKMRTIDCLFDEFAKQLKFPSYFGRNGNAFIDLMSDLSWFESKEWVVVVHSGEELLADEPGELDWFGECIDDIGERWNESIELGEVWDRTSIPFHLLIVLNNSTENGGSSRFSDLPELVLSTTCEDL